MGRTFVIGDIHGGYKALLQCIDRSGFNPDVDELICLGDVCDGWPQVKECFDYLLELPFLEYIRGNHDQMTLNWADTGDDFFGWKIQGGYATIESYHGKISKAHHRFLSETKFYTVRQNQLFVHGGIDTSLPVDKQDSHTLMWDRSFFRSAFDHRNEENPPKLTNWDAIYIGHTPVHNYGYHHPLKSCEVWMMDTGAGWDGVLSIMDVGKKEFWTSDPMKSLYPDHKGRFVDAKDIS